MDVASAKQDIAGRDLNYFSVRAEVLHDLNGFLIAFQVFSSECGEYYCSV